MNPTSPRPVHRWIDVSLAVLLVGLILNCMMPVEHSIGRWLAEQVLYVLLASLAVGAGAFLLHRKELMLLSFSGSIALCSFLKEAQNAQFSYARNGNDIQIRVANFNVSPRINSQQLVAQALHCKADLIALNVQDHPEGEAALAAALKPGYPYRHRIAYDPSSAFLLYSTRPLHTLDTFHMAGIPLLEGSIFIDSVHGVIQFVHTHLNAQDQTPWNHIKSQLAQIGTYLKTNSLQQPLLTLGQMQLTGWSPEMTAFKEYTKLKDSRFDLEWQPSYEHIFYSNHLECIHFETLLDGVAVVGTYQFRPQEASKNNAPQKGHLTMF